MPSGFCPSAAVEGHRVSFSTCTKQDGVARGQLNHLRQYKIQIEFSYEVAHMQISTTFLERSIQKLQVLQLLVPPCKQWNIDRIFDIFFYPMLCKIFYNGKGISIFCKATNDPYASNLAPNTSTLRVPGSPPAFFFSNS